MDKNYLIQLTQNLYRLTLFFPKKEPLRYKMREVADNILAKSHENSSREIEKDLAVLDGFFEVALAQNWLSPSDLLAIKKEYDNLKIERAKKEEKSLTGQGGNSERQRKILAFLRENGRCQVQQLKQILPEVTKRTLRRDFEQMLSQGIIERRGERNDTFYQIKRTEI